MKAMSIFDTVNDEVGEIIVADVNSGRIKELLGSEQVELRKLIGTGS
jgi:isocitrate lyase